MTSRVGREMLFEERQHVVGPCLVIPVPESSSPEDDVMLAIGPLPHNQQSDDLSMIASTLDPSTREADHPAPRLDTPFTCPGRLGNQGIT